MKKIVRLTESDLVNLVKRVINEQGGDPATQIKKYCENCKKYSNHPQTQISPRSNRIADEINDAIEGMGTDFDALLSAIKSISNYAEFCSVVFSYRKSYGESLEEAIDSDVDGSDLTQIYRAIRDLNLRD